jgi:polyhydroxyalkanoate synthesis repressor PhaR
MLVKKYGNRRLYDTVASRYITLEELAEKIRSGSDARVVDAKTGEDLTQSTLTQIILESRGAGKLLPIPLLIQLIRLGDDALADFMGRYVSWALEMYLQTKQVAFGPFSLQNMVNPFARMMGMGGMGGYPEPPPPQSSVASEMAEMRRELEALKKQSAPARKRRK